MRQGNSTTDSGVHKTKRPGVYAIRLSATSVPAPALSYKVGSTLTLRLPMQRDCNFIVGPGVYYFTVSFSLFCFVSFPVLIPAFITCRTVSSCGVIAIGERYSQFVH